MGRKLLVTVGDELEALYGVRFIRGFFRTKEDMELSLLHVAPRFESMGPKESLRQHEMDTILSGIYAKKGQKALDASREILQDAGFSSRKITTKMIHKHYGMIQDVLHEARQGKYDAVILGRRGHSIFEKVLYPRLSSDILRELEANFPIWVCKRTERKLRNVLLCTDGSAHSSRIAEHVALMLKEEEQHSITIIYIDDGKGTNGEEILEDARERLLSGDIAPQRISSLVIQSQDITKAICNQAIRGTYAVVAVGRHGAIFEKNPQERFMSSTSMALLEALEETSLWLGH